MTPEEYEARLEDHYLKTDVALTDVELHNVTVKIDRAVSLFKLGLDDKTIRAELKKMDADSSLRVGLNDSEKARDRIQKYLIERGYKKDSKDFESKEKELMLKWARE